jgi:nitrite reductase/ring-hydroxylating ferredoxin subunit
MTPQPQCYSVWVPPADSSQEFPDRGRFDVCTGQAHDQEERYRRLEDWARRHLPTAGLVTHRWAGQVLETPDGLAFIGRNPGQRHVYVVTGDSGMGLTHGTIAGLMVPDLIESRPHAWAELYSPARISIAGVGTVVMENARSALSYASWLTPGEVAGSRDVPPGTGAVIREGLTKLAVYRAPDGTEHRCSAVCPHLGAVVTWNATEKTWDCPAHGSRFDCEGHVIQGPANADLGPVEPAVAGR